MPAVLDLIKELAAFEKEPDAVVVTVEDLERDGFDKNPLIAKLSCVIRRLNVFKFYKQSRLVRAYAGVAFLRRMRSTPEMMLAH